MIQERDERTTMSSKSGPDDRRFVALQVTEFIQSRPELYEHILTFGAVNVDALQKKLQDEGNLHCAKALLVELLDQNGIVCQGGGA